MSLYACVCVCVCMCLRVYVRASAFVCMRLSACLHAGVGRSTQKKSCGEPFALCLQYLFFTATSLSSLYRCRVSHVYVSFAVFRVFKALFVSSVIKIDLGFQNGRRFAAQIPRPKSAHSLSVSGLLAPNLGRVPAPFFCPTLFALWWRGQLHIIDRSGSLYSSQKKGIRHGQVCVRCMCSGVHGLSAIIMHEAYHAAEPVATAYALPHAMGGCHAFCSSWRVSHGVVDPWAVLGRLPTNAWQRSRHSL